MKRFRLLKNAALLTVTGFVLRALGMVFRIYISGRIGEEGMGVYQLILSAYFLFITIAQSGIAVTVTRLCSRHLTLKDRAGAYRVLKSALAVALLTGLIAGVGMFSLSGVISRAWIADPRAVGALRVLAFALPFTAVCSVLSAYFIAEKTVVYGCVAQIIEQLVRMGAVLLAAVLFERRGLAVLLTAVVFANTLSEAVSCLYLRFVLYHKYARPHGCRADHKRQVVRASAPIAASRYIAAALHTAENMLVPSAVALFTHSRKDALSAFGALKGMALPLLFFPSSFLGAMSTLLVPEVTEADARRDRTGTARIIDRAVYLTLNVAVMAAGVFYLYAGALGRMIYHSDRVGGMLRLLAPVVPFMYLDSICDGLLKGLGLQRRVLLHNCIDSGVRILLIALVVPRFGINGFIAVMAVSNLLISLLNLELLIRTAGVKRDLFGWFLRPALIALGAGAATAALVPSGGTVFVCLGGLLYCCIFLAVSLVFDRKRKI